MAEQQLKGTKVAFFATNGVEDSELSSPWEALKNAGAENTLISLEPGKVTSLKLDWEPGSDYSVDKTVEEVAAAEFDAVVLPGGTLNADALRTNKHVLNFVQEMTEAKKPVAAICHAPWIFINADLAQNVKLTSVPTISRDLQNAGAQWVDEEVVTDRGITTSRTPKDLEAFNAQVIEEIAKG